MKVKLMNQFILLTLSHDNNRIEENIMILIWSAMASYLSHKMFLSKKQFPKRILAEDQNIPVVPLTMILLYTHYNQMIEFNF